MLLRRYLALDIKGPRCFVDLISADADIQFLMSVFEGKAAEVAMPRELPESKCHKTKFDTGADTPFVGSND